MLAIIAVTLINQLMLMFGAKYHFLFSASMPYYLNWLARQLDIGGFKVVATLLTLVLYVAYAACWLFSGQRREWLLASLGLYGVDTLLLIVFAISLLENPSSCVLEVLTHCIGLGLMYLAYYSAQQLDRLPRRRRPRFEENTSSV